MQNESYVDAICGSASCLVFGSDRVIVNFDWVKNSFTWVTLQKCLTKLALNRDQFVNVCLLSGSSILPTFPKIDIDVETEEDTFAMRVPAARTLIGRAGYDANNLFRDAKDQGYQELFQKAQFAVKHPVVITSDGKVEPLNWESGPNDAHDFIGRKLPEEIYAYLSFGIAGPRVLNWRTRMEILETPPLDGGESEAYKKLVQEKLPPLRAQALALITPSLHRWYQKQDVKLVCWWNDGNETPLNVADVVDSSGTGYSWHVKADFMPTSQDSQTTPITYAIASLADDDEAKKTVTPRAASDGPQLRSATELRANSIWRFLEDRGYINSDHTLSAWGRALKESLDRAAAIGLVAKGLSDTEIEEAILMAFEMLRLDVLNSKNMFPLPPYSGAPMRGSQEDRSHNLLVSRIACLGRFHHGEIGYTGPLSKHLLAYHQMVASVRGALRDLVEMHTCNMMLSGAADRSLKKSEYHEIGAGLPFLNEPDIGLGLVVKSHLDEQSRPSPESRTSVKLWFNHVEGPIQGDLDKAWDMWDVVSELAAS